MKRILTSILTAVLFCTALSAQRTTVTGEAETSITGNKRLDRLARYCKK